MTISFRGPFEVPYTIITQGVWNHNIGDYLGPYSSQRTSTQLHGLEGAEALGEGFENETETGGRLGDLRPSRLPRYRIAIINSNSKDIHTHESSNNNSSSSNNSNNTNNNSNNSTNRNNSRCILDIYIYI